MATHKEAIVTLFVTSDNRRMYTGEILSAMSHAPKQSIYAAINSMYKANELEGHQVGGSREYALPVAVFESQRAILASAKELASRLGVVEPGTINLDVKIPENACAEVDIGDAGGNAVQVTEVPEGVKAKRRHVVWDQHDRETFAMCFLQALREHPTGPAIGFTALAEKAVAKMPKEKQKQIFNKQQVLPWFDDELEKAKRIMQRADQQAAEEEEQRQREEEHKRTMQNYKDAAQNMPMDIFMGELMRRGTTLIENMFIQALGSPRVRESLQSALGTGTRQQQRHDPLHGQNDDRPRLKKVLIYGLNKPVQQNEIKNTFGDLFDLRFLAVRANPGQLKAHARPADIVLILKEHVNHSDVDIIIANTANYKRIDGGIGNLRMELHAMTK